MKESSKAIVLLNRSVSLENRYVAGESFKSDVANEILARVIYGESLLDICKEEGMPSLLSVRIWEKTRPDFKNNLMLALKERGRNFLERRAGLLKELEDEILVEKANTGKINLKALKEYMTYSEKLAGVHDEEQDMRRRGNVESDRGAGGGVPILKVVNPFAGQEDVDIEAMKVENNRDSGDV